MKKRIYQIFYVIALLFVVLFLGFTLFDWITYDVDATSFPLYALVIFRMYQFLLPAFIFFGIGFLIKRFFNKKMKSFN